MSDTEVTIVIVAHSERRELGRCLGSIRDHAAMPVQVILVDNASTDDSVTWVRGNHPAIEIVELDENVGVAARQHGLARSESPLTMFLDGDAALTDRHPVRTNPRTRLRPWRPRQTGGS